MTNLNSGWRPRLVLVPQGVNWNFFSVTKSFVCIYLSWVRLPPPRALAHYAQRRVASADISALQCQDLQRYYSKKYTYYYNKVTTFNNFLSYRLTQLPLMVVNTRRTESSARGQWEWTPTQCVVGTTYLGTQGEHQTRGAHTRTLCVHRTWWLGGYK